MLADGRMPIMKVDVVEQDLPWRSEVGRSAVGDMRMESADAAGHLTAKERDVRGTLHPETEVPNPAEGHVISLAGKFQLPYGHPPQLEIRTAHDEFARHGHPGPSSRAEDYVRPAAP